MEYQGTFSSFSVDNVEEAKKFYGETLGIPTSEEMMGLKLELGGGGKVHIYQKDDHQPAGFTVLNFVVENIDAAIDSLKNAGITMEHYDNMPAPQDEKGILRGLAVDMGPDIAWFKDPAGNIIAVLQEV